MADAREKLQQAIAAQRAKGKPLKPAKGSAKAPAKPARKSTADKPAPKPAADKPSKSVASLFKKSKKSDKPKKAAPRPKKEKSGSRGPGLFQKFTQNLVDELKKATNEITPRALIDTAAESIQNLKSMVGLDETGEDQEGARGYAAAPADAGARETNGAASEARRRDPESGPMDADAAAAPPSPGPAAPAADAAGAAPANFSPAKVQRAPKKKPKPESGAEEAAAGIAELEADSPQSGGAGASVEAGLETPSPDAEPSTAGAEAAPVEFSPTKVQRPTKKKPKQEEDGGEEAPGAEEAFPSDEEPEGAAPFEEEAPEEKAEQAPEEAPEAKEEEPPGAGEQPEAGEPEPEAPAAAEKAPDKKEEEPKKKKKPKQRPAQPAVKLSKTDQALKSFQALQTVLRNPVWAPIVVNLEAKPSSLFSPRERFDTRFPDPTFREGLKAANRLATTFCFGDPDKILFNEKVVEQVKAFQLDPEGKIKKESDLPSKVLDEETVKKALGLYKDPRVRHLLFSVGTRLGTFVPTIEILARIYFGLRKKADINPGQRLAIQEEVLLRYKKAPYPDAKAKKARNLALNYFTDYLLDHGMKLYKDRFADAPEGQNNLESHVRRHKMIKSHCFNLFEERAARLGISQPALINLKARFSETADLFLKEQLGDIPEELLEEFRDNE